MIYMSIDKRYPYMAMLCELIDEYFVETLLCSGGGKMGVRGIHRRERAKIYNADCRARVYFNGSEVVNLF